LSDRERDFNTQGFHHRSVPRKSKEVKFTESRENYNVGELRLGGGVDERERQSFAFALDIFLGAFKTPLR
jgi:hypothetical protein